jgi:hypothetical protein
MFKLPKIDLKNFGVDWHLVEGDKFPNSELTIVPIPIPGVDLDVRIILEIHKGPLKAGIGLHLT